MARNAKKAGHAPRFSVSYYQLLPVAFNQNPSAIALFPMMADPDGAGMGWVSPKTVNPDVAVAVPAMMSFDPYPSVMRWMVMLLNDGRRRRNADNDLRHCNRGSEAQSEQPCQKSLFHRNLYLRGLDLPESGRLFLAINHNNPGVGDALRAVEKIPSKPSR